MKKFVPALGLSDFRAFREAEYGYVDKTGFVSDILSDSSMVLLFPRPRRFGKTINLSMLGYFLRKTNEDLSYLFRGLAVADDSKAMAHFQKYPVIAITFKDVKARTLASAMTAIREHVVETYHAFRWLLDENKLDPTRANQFQRVLSGAVTDDEMQHSLKWLSHALYEHYRQRVVILIDEYDTPVQSGYMNGYFDDVVEFFRNFFSACLKDNAALFKGVLTGILRVSKENMFSGLNHIKVYSILDEPFSTTFGFTEDEVASILPPERLGDARDWYNGYIFGGNVIYNPWSILCYAKEGLLKPYWVNTGSTDLIETLALKQGLGLSETSANLLNDGTIDVPIESNIVLRDVDKSPHALWNFLLFSGYLKIVDMKLEMGEYIGQLAIPNLEVRLVYRAMFRTWLSKADPQSHNTNEFVKALLVGDAAHAQKALGRILLTAMSYQDPAGAQPEKLYHGFILGLLVHLENQYEVRSNRESGYGRADVLLRPKTPERPGIVIEFKVIDEDETADEVLKDAAKQVRDRQYATALVTAGVTSVLEYVMAFDGKRAWVKTVAETLG